MLTNVAFGTTYPVWNHCPGETSHLKHSSTLYTGFDPYDANRVDYLSISFTLSETPSSLKSSSKEFFLRYFLFTSQVYALEVYH
jgi:hypothetical protein